MIEPTKIPKRDDVIQILRAWMKMRPPGKPARAWAVAQLGEYDHEQVLQILGELLEGVDPIIQNSALQILMRFDRERGVEIVLPLLQRLDSGMRVAICYSLCDFADERAVEPLIQTLQNDSESNVRHIATVALGKIGAERAIPALEYAAEHDKGVNYEDDPISRVAKQSIEWIRERNTK